MSLKDLAKKLRQQNNEDHPEESFLSMLNECIARMNPERAPSKSYKPSSLGTCYRQNYYQVTGAVVDVGKVSSDLVGMGESGTARHEHIQRYVSSMNKYGYPVRWVPVSEYLARHPQDGVKIRSVSGFETSLRYEPLNMNLMCDGIIQFKGIYYILEIKTETDFKWLPRIAPNPDHIVQASAYSLVLGLDKVLFLYENRNVCAKKTFIYEVSDRERLSIVEFIKRCDAYIALNQLPPKTANIKDCTYCRYKTICDLAGDTAALTDDILGVSFSSD
jgi:CRISPR/Cas system-associated exonuclease Cas4 (RecB family)